MINIKLNLNEDFFIVIGAHKIDVKFVDGKNKKLNEEENDVNYGKYIPEEKTIYINKICNETMKMSTFLHESIHAIEDVFSFQMNHTHVNIISEMMAQFLLQNSK